MRSGRLASLYALALTALVSACATQATDTGSGGSSDGGQGGESVSSTTATAGGQGGDGGDPATTSSTTSATSSSSSGEGGAPPNNCGNGVIDSGETCEGDDFGGKTCADFGLATGTLVCNPFCNIVLSGCTPAESCNDGQDNDLDSFVDCADSDCVAALACTDSCASALVSGVPTWNYGNISGEPAVIAPSCTATSGREVVLAVTAAITGDLIAQLTPYSFDGSISIRMDCDDASTEIACVNNGGVGQTENVSIPAVAGETYYVILESTTDTATGYFDAFVDQPFPEQYCYDHYDDDFDGLLDCDDPTNCKGTSFDCTPGTQGYGTSCFGNTDCQASGGDPICLNWQEGFNNGYCSEFCDPVSNPCLGDGVCVDINLSQNGVCFDGCVTTSDCQNGLACVDIGGGVMVCDKAPETNCLDYADNDSDGFYDCEDPLSCDNSPHCTPGPGAAGVPCQLHTECASANGTDPLCIDQFHVGWPGGYCSEWCTVGGNDCAAGATCVDWVFLSPSANGQCLDICTTSADCRSGYFCTNVGPGVMACVF